MTFLRSLFQSESQSDPHHWAATALGHFAIMMGPWGLLAIAYDKFVATVLVAVIYAAWEIMQFYLAERKTRALVWDCILDWCAVTLGAVMTYYVGTENYYAAMWVYCGFMAMIYIGAEHRA